MTQDEIQREVDTRAELIARLPQIIKQASALRHILDNTDRRIWEYCHGVLSDPDRHNLYELLGVERFFDILFRYGWNAKRVKRFFKLYERIRFSGLTGRQRYKLTPVQCYQFAHIFGPMLPDGRRLCRTAYIFVPRKYSKTTSSAALAVNDMLFGDYNAQAYVGANSYKQAKICFDEIRAIMRDIDPGERHFRVNREEINFKTNERDSLARCLSGNPKTLDGLNASLVIMDEYSQARNTATRNGADLKNVLTSSMGARREPLTVVITTASEVVDGPFAEELAGVKCVLRGERKADTVFALIFEPDVGDLEDDPATWAKVQPHMGITVQPDYYKNAWEEAQLSAENMMTFRTKLLNIFATCERRSWIKSEALQNVMTERTLHELPGTPEAMCGVDLSISDDFTAVTIAAFIPSEKVYYYHTAYFFPEGNLSSHPNERLYRRWAKEGHLILTQGPAIDYRQIVEYILEANEHIKILRIGYDPNRSGEFINMLASAGARKVLTGVPQTYRTFTSPTQTLARAIKLRQVQVHNNPITAYCFGNVALDIDNCNNCKPVPRVSSGKIDGVITMLMATELFLRPD